MKNSLGANFEIPKEQELKSLALDYGVRVKKLGPGKLAKSGVREGFIITRIDNQKIYAESDIYEMLEGRKGGVLIEGKYADGTDGYYGLGLR